ncbi:MAG: Uncharacterized protein FD141_89 [Fusobacteria bacterium]|nr:MAG: Uncharacterized protein FD141_89 [Fusobacteriota bacterium]KAF0229247.1 MAG: hypothetical protein FD182_1503 [Fusobacteriota bacterium]
MKNSVLEDKSNIYSCTGCGVCRVACPHSSITIELSVDGFYEPVIDENTCTDCGLCKRSCYMFDQNILKIIEEDCLVYSAANKDAGVLKSSTSGGVSSELMKECLNQGFKVLGVAYDYNEDIAVTKIVSIKEEIEQFKGSKYFQSFTSDAFAEALEDKSGQKYAVFGTPCQIYGVSKYAEFIKHRERFLLIDIFCHGCPSMNLWKKYLKYSENKFGVSNFTKVEFRSKAYGWHEFSTTFYKDDRQYKSSKFSDPFYSIFFDKNALNEACYNCKVRSTLAYTDIRLGDFWGYQYDNDISGVSAVMVSTDRGKSLFESVSDRFRIVEHNFLETIYAQSYGKNHDLNEPVRSKTLKLLSSSQSLEEIIRAYKKSYSLNKKIEIKIKNIIKLLPQKLYLRIKKLSHKI